MHCVSCLRFKRVPVRGYSRDENAVAGLEILDERADLDNFSTAFMTEYHVVPVAYGALPDGVNVRGADGDRQRLAYCVQRSTDGDVLLDPTGFADFEHCVTFHVQTSFRKRIHK